MAVVFWGLASMLVTAIVGIVLLRIFVTRRPPSGSDFAAAAEGFRDKEYELAEDYVSYEVKLVLFSVLTFLYPVMLLWLLHSKPTVRYWFGWWTLAAAIAVPVWVVLCMAANWCRVLSKGSMPLYVVVLPLLALAILFELQFWSLGGKGVVLLSKDCDASLQKENLEQAWWAIHDVYADCTQQLASITGSDVREEGFVARFEDCERLVHIPDRWTKEWRYLRQLEKDQHCGGWCTAQRPIWTPSSTAQDACSNTVAREMTTDIWRMAQQAKMYCTLLLLGICAVLLVRPHLLQELRA